MKYTLIGIALALFAYSCAAPTSTTRPSGLPDRMPDIRVLLEEGHGSATIAVSNGVSVKTEAGMTLLESKGAGKVVVSIYQRNIEIKLEPSGRVATAEGVVKIVPNGASHLGFKGITYAGVVGVSAVSGGKLRVTNMLPLETYLEGVLPHEMGNPGTDGFDALKTQAVAARTYALGRIMLRSSEPFDVFAGVQDQVYKGQKGSNKHASSAVRDTRGMVMNYDGELVKAYYCACCGGHTSDIHQVWPHREPADYLLGIADRGDGSNRAFCYENRYFRWRYSFSGSQIGEILRTTLPKVLGIAVESIGDIKDLRVDKRTNSGRVIKLTIVTTKGDFTVEGDRIRWALMVDLKKKRILPSVMFRLEKFMESDRLAFVSIVGGGNGHGVGMCQNGAIAMAKKGYTYKMILKHYYPGCQVIKAY